MSPSGYVHLIVRGIGRQALFEVADDYRYYLAILQRFSRETEITICAYCLMENHVHLLARDLEGSAALMMKKLGVSYSHYFNLRYGRQGHLFQDRYLSEPIRDDAQFLTALRYILNNPQKAGLGPAASYPWSSYRLYGQPSWVDTSLPRDMLGDDAAYAAFIAAPNEDQCLEYDASPRSDDWARQALRRRLGVESGTALQAMDRRARDEAIKQLLAEGLSIRQIERLTGISRGIVQRQKT